MARGQQESNDDFCEQKGSDASNCLSSLATNEKSAEGNNQTARRSTSGQELLNRLSNELKEKGMLPSVEWRQGSGQYRH
jgi:hypothetical protein